MPDPKPDNWAAYSLAQYTVPVIGCVSRDGRRLTALVSDTANNICQAWHDCLHNNAEWRPVDAPPTEQTRRVVIYYLPNDPDMLLERACKDFPFLRKRLEEQRAQTALPAQVKQRFDRLEQLYQQMHKEMQMLKDAVKTNQNGQPGSAPVTPMRQGYYPPNPWGYPNQ